MDIYSDSAEMSRRKAFFVYLLFVQMNPMMSSFTGQNHLIVQWARELNEGIKNAAGTV